MLKKHSSLFYLNKISMVLDSLLNNILKYHHFCNYLNTLNALFYYQINLEVNQIINFISPRNLKLIPFQVYQLLLQLDVYYS